MQALRGDDEPGGAQGGEQPPRHRQADAKQDEMPLTEALQQPWSHAEDADLDAHAQGDAQTGPVNTQAEGLDVEREVAVVATVASEVQGRGEEQPANGGGAQQLPQRRQDAYPLGVPSARHGQAEREYSEGQQGPGHQGADAQVFPRRGSTHRRDQEAQAAPGPHPPVARTQRTGGVAVDQRHDTDPRSGHGDDGHRCEGSGCPPGRQGRRRRERGGQQQHPALRPETIGETAPQGPQQQTRERHGGHREREGPPPDSLVPQLQRQEGPDGTEPAEGHRIEQTQHPNAA